MADHFELSVEKLEGRARAGNLALWAFIAASLVEIVCAWIESSGTVDLDNGDDLLTAAVGLGYIVYFLVFVASLVMVAMWIHRAHANLFASGIGGLEFSPGWSVGWFFVPVANLFKPFQAMRELWNASAGAAGAFQAETPSELRVWWGAWLAGNIVSSVAARLVLTGETTVSFALDAASTILLIVAAWYLMGIIRAVTSMQRGGAFSAHAFT